MEAKKMSTETVEVDSTPKENEPTYVTTPFELEQTELDLDEFRRGVKEASYVCGLYTAYVNSGISLENAMDLILLKSNVDLNIKITELNSKSAIESAKESAINIEKQSV